MKIKLVSNEIPSTEAVDEFRKQMRIGNPRKELDSLRDMVDLYEAKITALSEEIDRLCGIIERSRQSMFEIQDFKRRTRLNEEPPK